MKVPFVDLKAQHDSIKQEIGEAIQNTLENNSFILGPQVEEFEKNFATYCNSKYCVGVNSGTAALHLALLASGISKDDEVITVPNTFFATAEAISHTGAKPVFIDIDEESYNMNPELLEQAITEQTKAIIPVHLYGNSCDMEKINKIAKKYNLALIEDACQSHGAEYKGKKVPISDIGCFSFYPAKNLGALGEAGAIITNNEEIANKTRLLRAHGEFPKNTHTLVGYNYRMHGLQGAVLNAKLKYLESWNQARIKAAGLYTSLLKNILITPKESQDTKHVFHLYVVRSSNRDKLREFLKNKDIDTGIHYEKPIHLQKAYSELGYKPGSLPIAEKVMKEIISLPIYPAITSEQIIYVVDSIKEFLSQYPN